MFSINDKDIQRLQADLKVFAKRAYPFATKQTINKAAFTARGFAQDNIRENMVTRNRFTVQSVQVDQARTLNVSRQVATVGSIADYMEDQEFGGLKSKGGKEGVAIATPYSSGESQDAQPRKRLPRKPNVLANIRLSKRVKRKGSKLQQNLVKVREAAAAGRRYVFLELRRRKGIFRVLGGKRKPRIKMVWSMTKQSVVIPKNPWLKPAVDKTQPLVAEIYKQALIFQLKRNKLFV